MNTKKEYIEAIKKHIEDADYESSFNMIKKILPQESSLNHDLSIQISRYNNIKRENYLGVISTEKKLEMTTPIYKSLLEIVHKIEYNVIGQVNTNKESDQNEAFSIAIEKGHVPEKNLMIRLSNLRRFFISYLQKRMFVIYFIVETIVLSFIFFIISFFICEKIFHAAGDYDVRFKRKFIFLFILVAFGMYYLSLPLLRWMGYYKKHIFNIPIEASIVAIFSIMFFWSSNWIISPINIPNIDNGDSTVISTLTQAFSSEEVIQISLIESEIINSNNMDLICSGVSAFKSYQHDRALQSLFLLLDKRKSSLSNVYFYGEMLKAFISYKDKPVDGLKEIFRMNKDSLTSSPRSIIMPILDSTLIPINRDLDELKGALGNPELNEIDKVEILNNIKILEGAIQITSSKIQSALSKNTEGKNLLLKFIIDVFSKNEYILQDEAIYSESKEMALNNRLDFETRKKFMQIVVMYRKQSDASYFVKILRENKEEEIKIEAIRCLQILQDKKMEIGKK